MTMHLNHLQITEPRHLLYAGVPKASSPHNTVKGVHRFLGFANYYREFIEDYAKLVRPLTELTRKNVRWRWDSHHESAIQRLKHSFVSAPLRVIFSPERETRIHADASDHTTDAVLSQLCRDGKWHPVAFESKSLDVHQRRYHIFDKELLAILRALCKWRYYVLSVDKPVTVITDHRNLQYFTEKRDLSDRQVRWMSELGGYDFTLTYRPGEDNGAADALSRRDDPTDSKPTYGALFPPAQHRKTTFTPLPGTFLQHQQIRYMQDHDSLLVQVKQFLLGTCRQLPAAYQSLRPRLSLMDDLVVIDDEKVIIGNDAKLQTQILQRYHDSWFAGHPGAEGTLDLIQRHFWWHGLRDMVRKYVTQCPDCQTVKSPRRAQYGKHQPLPIPSRPFEVVSVDFIVGLPQSGDPHASNNAILVMCDMFTRYMFAFPASDTFTSKDTFQELFLNVFVQFGVPRAIVSDRGPQFVADFWEQVLNAYGARPNMSTAYHPQTDGLTERWNQEIKKYLQFYTKNETDWAALLPFAMAAYNNRVNKSLGCSPFYALFGYHPNTEFRISNAMSNQTVEQYLEHLAAVRDSARSSLEASQARQKQQIDPHRRPPPFKVGQSVLLSTKNLGLSHTIRKFQRRWIGPFMILSKVNDNAYRLQLPTTWRHHNVVNVAHLRPFYENTFDRELKRPDQDIDYYTNNPLKLITVDHATRDFDGSVVYQCSQLGPNGLPQRVEYSLEQLSAYRDLVALVHDRSPSAPKPPGLAQFLSGSALGGGGGG
jgi:hypothetical protein